MTPDHSTIPTALTWPADVISASAIVAAIIGWLPPIAAVLGIVWYCILIYDRFHKPRWPSNGSPN